MKDLLYCETGAKELGEKLKEKFPSIKIEECWDDVHQERLQVDIDDVHKKDYLKFIIKEVGGDISLYIGLVIGRKERQKEIEDILDELKKEEAKK